MFLLHAVISQIKSHYGLNLEKFEMLTVQTIHPQSGFFIKTIPSTLKLSAELANEIDSLWLTFQKRQGKELFNGRILSAATITNEKIEASITEYRYLIAQQARPELFNALQLRAIGVSGLLLCADGLVFGRRADKVTQGAGLWELVPSGSIDASKIVDPENVDFLSQILTELQEETGIKAEKITQMRPFCVVEDSNSHVLDIGIVIKCPLLFDEIVAIHQNNATNEYDELRLIPIARVSQIMKQEAAQFVEVSAVLIQHFQQQSLDNKV